MKCAYVCVCLAFRVRACEHVQIMLVFFYADQGDEIWTQHKTYTIDPYFEHESVLELSISYENAVTRPLV